MDRTLIMNYLLVFGLLSLSVPLFFVRVASFIKLGMIMGIIGRILLGNCLLCFGEYHSIRILTSIHRFYLVNISLSPQTWPTNKTVQQFLLQFAPDLLTPQPSHSQPPNTSNHLESQLQQAQHKQHR